MVNRGGQWIYAAGMICLLAGLVACGSDDDHQAPPPPASLEIDPSQMQALRRVSSAPVAVEFGSGFEVQKRRHQIGQFPCSRCHDQPQAEVARSDADERWAHANIRATHPTPGNCQTCHNYDDLQTLRSLEGDSIDIDEVYRLCSQCHFQQARDWAGGAHGKRLAGWRGRRVIMNCTDCHDPHAPAFGPQIPLAGPRVPRTGQVH